MTKLSERVPTMLSEFFGDWLKELAEYVEFIDRRDRLAYRSLREQLSKPDQRDDVEYEPQTYDEAIALCKGWKRCVNEFGLVHWETPTGAWWVIDPNDRIGFCEADYENYNLSWERNKWPELWRELVGAEITNLYLSEISENTWVFNLDSTIYTDSTPGRVVCQIYLRFKGHVDWAERLSK